MGLEALLKAWKEAEAKALENPSDKSLLAEAAKTKKAYDDAKAEADAKGSPGENGGGEGDDDSDEFDEAKADEKTKAYIAKLRKEAAGNRVKSKELASKLKSEEEKRKAILKAAGIELEEEKPEEKIKSLTASTEQYAFRSAILEKALEHGISKDSIDYFEFLIQKTAGELDEGEELSDEQMAVIVTKVKKAGKGSANSTVGAGGGEGGSKSPKPGDGGGSMTLEKFCSLSIMEKSKLYEQDAKVYEAFAKEARAKRKLV